MKKIFCILISAALLFSFAGCGKQPAPDENKTEKAVASDKAEPENANITDISAKNAFMENWLKYLDFNEKKFSSIIWGAEYIKQFCKNPDVAGYRRAVSAAETVGATLKVLEAPVFSISENDYNTILEINHDLSFVEAEISAIKADTDSDLALWESLSHDILTEAFWSYGTEYLDKTADILLLQAEANTDYLRYTTNYLYLVLGYNKYPADVTKNYPTVFRSGNDFISDETEINKKSSASLDMLEKVNSDHSEIESIQKANISILSEAVSTGDYSKVESAALDWAKKSTLIPVPAFGTLPTVYTYRKTADKSQWISAGENLSVVPAGLLLEYENVSKKSFTDYAELINSMGAKLMSSTGEYSGSSAFSVALKLDNTEISADWDNGYAAVLVTDPEAVIAPSWYISYCLKTK